MPVCPICSHAFERVKQPGRPAKFCSTKCRREDGRIRARALGRAKPAEAVERVKQWRLSNPGRRNEWERKRYKEVPEVYRARVDRWLDSLPDVLEYHREQVRNWRIANPHASAQIEQARRARLQAQYIEHVDYLVVFERDQWMCGICRKLTIWPARFARDPEMASLDHIIPLARDGEHSYANTQCAHLRCNMKKSANVS